MMYQGFAAVYDRLMAEVDYVRWADYYFALAKRSGVSVQRVADAACGTGNLSLALAARGVTVTGLDLSVEMLAIAGAKARAAGCAVPFVRQDIRKLLLHRPMDAVFCACDGVNYLVRPADAQAFFSSAFQALRPGGGLFFDVSTEYKLKHLLGDRCLGDDGEDVSYIWQNHYDETARQVQMDLTFFVREGDGRYCRFSETHVQRAHRVQELIMWLKEAGFVNIQVYGDQRWTGPDDAEARAHFAAVRPD